MNKFTLAFSAILLSATAFAQQREVKALDVQPVKAAAPALAADDQEWKDLGEGTYSDVVLSNLFVGYFNDPVKVQIQESVTKPGVYRLVNPWKKMNEATEFDESLNYLIIDASDPEYVMIPEQRSPVNDAVDGETWYCSYTSWAVDVVGVEKDYFKELQPDKVPVLKDGVIKFSFNSIAVMYPNGTGDEVAAGEWTYSNMEYEGYLALPGATYIDEWESLGKGKFLEGFLETIFDDTYVPEEREIEIMKNNRVPGVYKLVKAFEFSAPTGRDLILDARQPDFVRVEEQNTGVNSVRGWVYILSVSTNGTFTTYDEMVMSNPEYAERNITLDETGFHFPKNSILITFPTSGDYSAYVNGNAVESYFLFPGLVGVDGVEVEDSNAPAEYYNLQGMRMVQPQAGELVIVRKGSKTYKTIFR